jgi:hypothetical protein
VQQPRPPRSNPSHRAAAPSAAQPQQPCPPCSSPVRRAATPLTVQQPRPPRSSPVRRAAAPSAVHPAPSSAATATDPVARPGDYSCATCCCRRARRPNAASYRGPAIWASSSRDVRQPGGSGSAATSGSVCWSPLGLEEPCFPGATASCKCCSCVEI